MNKLLCSITRSAENTSVLQNLGSDNANESSSLYHSVISNVITPQEIHSSRMFLCLQYI